MYRNENSWKQYILPTVIFIILIYFFLILYIMIKIHSIKKYDDNNLKILDITTIGSDHKSIMRNIYSIFGDVFIVNGSYRFPKKPERKHNIILFQTEESNITSFPFISPNLISSQLEDNILIAGFKSLINSSGDFCFLNYSNEFVSWNSESEYIKQRTNNNSFLIDDETEDPEHLHYSYLIITRYLFNGLNAVHINYIVKKKGININSTKAFIKFLNFSLDFITKHKIFYYSIAGNANIKSAKWQKLIKKVFKDTCYISPGIESKFITDIDTKYGARASRFIIISKPMAPFGVYFYLTEQKIESFSSSNILVAEILKQKSFEKSPNDNTVRIYNNFIKERQINPSLRLDLETDNDVNFNGIDLTEKGKYKPVVGKQLNIKTINEVH